MIESDPFDESYALVATALARVARVLAYIACKNYMDSYEAACEARQAITDLQQVLKNYNT